jgi:hypothetical protein
VSETIKTLRDEFAMAALNGMLSYSHVNEQSGNATENGTPNEIARAAYAYADAMLDAREANP